MGIILLIIGIASVALMMLGFCDLMRKIAQELKKYKKLSGIQVRVSSPEPPSKIDSLMNMLEERLFLDLAEKNVQDAESQLEDAQKRQETALNNIKALNKANTLQLQVDLPDTGTELDQTLAVGNLEQVVEQFNIAGLSVQEHRPSHNKALGKAA